MAKRLLALLLVAVLASAPLSACSQEPGQTQPVEQPSTAPDTGNAATGSEGSELDLADIPAFDGSPYTVIADGTPDFHEDDLNAPAEQYAPLDSLGRCGAAFAIVSRFTMPTEERESIGMIKPSGWHMVRYDDLIADRNLYNRCHLIGYQLTAENANENNLITGTRYLNVEGMLPFENEAAEYVNRTGNRVLYRVTPVFVGDELVARGVQMEAYSIEDDGAGVCFNVFCYNVQPGIEIDYATGDSCRADDLPRRDEAAEQPYVLNVNTGKFHLPSCDSVSQMKDKNKREVTASRGDLIDQGYSPCANCNP